MPLLGGKTPTVGCAKFVGGLITFWGKAVEHLVVIPELRFKLVDFDLPRITET